MAYTKFHASWANGSDGHTPITADALDHIEDGIVNAADVADTAFTNAATAQSTADDAYTLPGSLPEVPAIPIPQDIVDALVELGFVTQAT